MWRSSSPRLTGASARTQASCAALSQSLEHYRMALAKEAGGFQKASSISDDKRT